MPGHSLSRRRLIAIAAATLGSQALLAACGGASSAPTAPAKGGAEVPTAAPAKPTEPPKPAAPGAPTTAPAATQAPAAQAKPAGGAKVELNVAHAWPAERWQEQVDFDKQFMEKNPNITVKATNTEFNEYFRKILAQAGSNTL